MYVGLMQKFVLNNICQTVISATYLVSISLVILYLYLEVIATESPIAPLTKTTVFWNWF